MFSYIYLLVGVVFFGGFLPGQIDINTHEPGLYFTEGIGVCIGLLEYSLTHLPKYSSKHSFNILSFQYTTVTDLARKALIVC